MKRHRNASQLAMLPCLALLIWGTAAGQQPASDTSAVAIPAANGTASPPVSQSLVDALLRELAAHEARIKELESKLQERVSPQTAPPPGASVPLSPSIVVPKPTGVTLAAITSPGAGSSPAASAPVGKATAPESSAPAIPVVPNPALETVATSPTMSTDAPDPHDHMLNMPGGGPTLKIRGFFDFDYGMGSVANPLIFPLGAPTHDTFQAGEFDLFISSKLSKHLSFIGEIVFGSDRTNLFGIDIERYELTYKHNKYFELSAGRYHTSIGYYNTAYHHGTWFGSADGRPFMYYYEDSGGLLPVHNVGLQATGLMPGTGSFNLHWVAEVGNGRASDPNAAEPVQNFLSDRNHKAVNFAMYVKPEWLEGLQLGGSYYLDKLYPAGIAGVNQHIGSFYAVYFKNGWESLNEGVLLWNQSGSDGRIYNTPLMYTQISHQFGAWVPFFRFQYVNAPIGDPINVFAGRYEGPSEGIRYNISDYAALKLQYNRIYGLIGNTKPANGLNANVSFTF